MVPLHPQPVPGDSNRLRWIIRAGTLGFAGEVARVPSALATLLADGTLAEVVVEPSAVVTRVSEGCTWAAVGCRVRTALHAALADPAGWIPNAATDPDAALLRLAQRLVETVIDPYARSHGGSVTVVDVSADVVTVRLGGSCSGCTAAQWSILDRLTRELRRHHASARAVGALR